MSQPVEILRVIYVGTDLSVVGSLEHTTGQRDAVTLPFRAIVEHALRLDATALVLSHNHPSGDPTPSRRDIMATHQLARIVQPLGIRVHDHVIDAASGRFSFREAGII